MNQAEGDDDLPYDAIRRMCLRELTSATGRACIVYASPWTEPNIPHSPNLNINRSDIQGFAEVLAGVTERQLDLVIHSGGGDPDAAEAIVRLLRRRFDHIRVFVPFSAMSAATMIALAADEIVLDEHSHLGPIDSQVSVARGNSSYYASAQAILDDFEMARQEFSKAGSNNAWNPIISQMHPGLVSYCRASQSRAKEMVAEWMEKYMFKERENAKQIALAIADHLADYKTLGSHGRPIDIEAAREIGISVKALGDDELVGGRTLHDWVLAVFHATALTLDGTGALKLIENHRGIAWARD